MTDERIRKCPRCQGFLGRDSIFNLEGQFHRIEVLRCLNCGERVDATILKAREAKKKNIGQQKDKQFSSRKAS